MKHFLEQNSETLNTPTLCRGCDLPLPVNDLGFCNDCYVKLERDLIRMRDWEYSAEASGVRDSQLEALRDLVIRDYGAAYELLEQPHEYKPKNKRSRSTNTKRKRAIAAAAVRDYTTEDVVQAARSFLQAQGEEWVNLSRLAHHLHERFYKLNPKHLGNPGKKYKSIIKFLGDMPDFVIRRDPEKSVYWIRRA
jgi:hypothetical protein